MVLTSTGDTALCPRQDDVVITFSNGRWEVGVAFRAPSISCGSREAAMTLARAFATAHHLDVWLSNGPSFECVVRSERIDDVSRQRPEPDVSPCSA